MASEGTVSVAENAIQADNQGQNGEVAQEGEQAEGQPQRPGGWSMIKTLLVRMFIIYLISSFFRRGSTPQEGEQKAGGPPAMPASNLFPKQTVMDLYVYITEQEKFTTFDEESLFWLEEELVYGDWTSGLSGDGTYIKNGQLKISEAVQNNGSIYMHVYLVKAGKSPNPKDKDNYSRRFTVHKMKQLNKYKKRHFHKLKNLLTGETEAHPDLVRSQNDTSVEILSHWHPNLTINLIDDHTPWTKGSVPQPLDDYIDFEPGTNSYYPVVFFNEYWNMNSEYQPINDTTKTLNMSLTYAPLSLFKWQMYAAQSMRNKWYSFLGDDFMPEESDDDQDSLKQAFLETSPYLLGLTIVVSIIHSIFEFLAFKNDIQFWRNRKSLEGLSVRSVFFNVFQSVIIVLYVMDHETNFVIRISVCVGLVIEIWKIHKVVNVKIDRENKLFGIVPRVWIEDKSTYTQSDTKKYDMLAFKYLSWVLYPLLVGYAIYSVLYQEHRGWYSWVLSMLYGFLLTFGFIMMTPQLFINYKLKSVAHLPWRMLTYKALNTFIDDLFAFVIKMPTLYRIGCFRDDIIFLIYLYQRYIYRVDPSRVNEFGTSAEMFDEEGKMIIKAPEEDEATNEPGTEAIEAAPKTEQAKKDD